MTTKTVEIPVDLLVEFVTIAKNKGEQYERHQGAVAIEWANHFRDMAVAGALALQSAGSSPMLCRDLLGPAFCLSRSSES